MTTLDRYRGCLLGLAAGDALGTTLEFKAPGTFEPIDDIVGGGVFRLKPGQWTDDTSMALCLAESLLILREFDPILGPDTTPLHSYSNGSWGPPEADRLVADIGGWHNPEPSAQGGTSHFMWRYDEPEHAPKDGG